MRDSILPCPTKGHAQRAAHLQDELDRSRLARDEEQKLKLSRNERTELEVLRSQKKERQRKAQKNQKRSASSPKASRKRKWLQHPGSIVWPGGWAFGAGMQPVAEENVRQSERPVVTQIAMASTAKSVRSRACERRSPGPP